MKNLKFLALALVLAISIVGCKKDEKISDDDVIKSRLIGTWTLKSIETNDYENGVLKSSKTETENSVNTIEFKTDGKCTTTGEDGIKSGSYSITNNGKSLNVIMDSETFMHEIRAILLNDLVLYMEDITTTTGVTRKFTSLATFRR